MRSVCILIIALVAAGLGGCTILCGPQCSSRTEQHSSSSLVEFLYPNGAPPPAQNRVPELHVPLRVGLAFLPGRGFGAGGPDAAMRQELLERVRQHFGERRFVSEIVIVPDYYLANQRGFAGLEAVQRLYSLDLMALVSYDQVTHSDENNWSLGYLTIVGMYVVRGNRYDVSTLVDLAVVDPATRSLVLRAGGTDTRHGNATLIEQSRESREAGGSGFNAAAAQMMQHFDTALTDFEAQVRAGHANVRVVHKDGAGGSGALTWPWLLALLPFVAARARRAPGSSRPSPRYRDDRPAPLLL
jgi:rhombotail lipoprotein